MARSHEHLSDKQTCPRVEMIDPLLVAANDAAELLGMSRSFFYENVSTGRIPPPVKIGKKSLWSTERLSQWARTEQEKAERVGNV